MSDDNVKRAGWYSFERLEVYHLAVKLRAIVKRIVARVPPGHDDDADQARRSCKSTVRNICEGGGEFSPREKARFYRMALRSAEETGGTLKILEEDLGTHPDYAEAHSVNYILIAKLIVLCKKTEPVAT